MTGDAACLAALPQTISGPIVLVGHSYGGAVMSKAATGNEQVPARPTARHPMLPTSSCPRSRPDGSASGLDPGENAATLTDQGQQP